MTIAERAATLRALHTPGKPLLLVNVWDAAGARILEELGFPAVATTSAGIAWREGYADGERIPRDAMFATVQRIASSVSVPLTADAERGYGGTPEAAAETARRAIEAGAVGLNLEDWIEPGGGLAGVDEQCALIEAMMAAGIERGARLVINARTDVYLQGVYDDATRSLRETIERANRYLAAGATCAFVPGVTDIATIRELVRAIDGPVSVLANAKSPGVAELAEAGVARISVGGASTAIALAAFKRFAREVQENGSFATIAQRIPHADLNALFE